MSLYDYRWGSNPYIKGTYSYRTIGVDALGITPNDLAKPLSIEKFVNGDKIDCPKVLFAGEATDFTRYGTMDGAMQSGKQQADRIFEYLEKISQNSQ